MYSFSLGEVFSVTKQEFATLVVAMQVMYGEDFIGTEQALDVWYALLHDLDYQILSKVLQQYMLTNKFKPKALYNIDEKGMNIEPVDGIYFSDRKREELFPKLQKVVDKVVRRMQDIVNLRGVVLDNVSGFENQMQNILVLAANKFSQAQIKSLNEYTKNKLIVPAKNEYIRKIDEIESNPEALKAIISAPDYFLDSYKKARLVGRVIKILVDEYGLVIDKKYNKFVEVYYNEIIKYRNALGHAMRSNEHADREVFIGEIDKTPLIFTEDLFRQMRASLNEYQQVINLVENSFNQI